MDWIDSQTLIYVVGVCHVFPDVAGRVAYHLLISMVDFLRVCVYIYKISFIATIHDPLVLLKPRCPEAFLSQVLSWSTVLPHHSHVFSQKHLPIGATRSDLTRTLWQ